MKKIYHALIIEDEPWTCEAYKNTLLEMGERTNQYRFSVDTAHNCPAAYERLMISANGIHYDMVFLDLRLPTTHGHKIRSGEDLGVFIREEMSTTKLIVVTGHFDAVTLNRISNTLKPDAFVVKGDIVAKDFIAMVEKVIDHTNFYSSRVQTLMKQWLGNKDVLDDLDVSILLEITKGSKMKELTEEIPLGDSAITKRKIIIKQKFGDRSMSDRSMILYAKANGFI